MKAVIGFLFKYTFYGAIGWGAWNAYQHKPWMKILSADTKLKTVLSELSIAPSSKKETNPCINRERCVAIFVAPWCSACHASLPFIRYLRYAAEKNKKFGVLLIIGGGEKIELERFSQQTGGYALLDDKNKFIAYMEGGALPHWFVWDKHYRVLRSFVSGAPDMGVTESHTKEFISEQLQLDEFLSPDFPRNKNR